MLLWLLWTWKLVSVHAESLHGPPAILNHHSCSVNKWVIFRNGSPVSFPKFLHSSLDPLAFFYSPLLQKKKDYNASLHLFALSYSGGKLMNPRRVTWTQEELICLKHIIDNKLTLWIWTFNNFQRPATLSSTNNHFSIQTSNVCCSWSGKCVRFLS